MVATPKSYLRAGPPESVADGLVAVGNGGSSSSKVGSARVYIRYTTAASNYSLEVYMVKGNSTKLTAGGDAKRDCYISNGTIPAGAQQC
jgi:hypothetical protein